MMKAFAILSLFALEAGAKKGFSKSLKGLMSRATRGIKSSGGGKPGSVRKPPSGVGKPGSVRKPPSGVGKPGGIAKPATPPKRDAPTMPKPSEDVKISPDAQTGDPIGLPAAQIQQGEKTKRLIKFVTREGKEIFRDTITGVLVNQINNALAGAVETTLAPGETTLAPTDPANCNPGCPANQRCIHGSCIVRPACETHSDCAPHGYCSSKGYCRFRKQDGDRCHGVTEKCLPGSVCSMSGLYYYCTKDPSGKWAAPLNCQDAKDPETLESPCNLADCNVEKVCYESTTASGYAKCKADWGSHGQNICPVTCGYCQPNN